MSPAASVYGACYSSFDPTPGFALARSCERHQVTVPTAETASATFWMEQRMAMGKAVMLVGPAGTGKTQLVMGVLRSLMGKPGNDYMTSKVNMNFYTR